MPKLWFCVPAHGRVELARVCLRQLRRTCTALGEYGIDANAVVIADDENLDTATELGFATVRRDNRFLSRKYNDGIQLACDPRFNSRPADYVVPCGSDDWVDHRIFEQLPGRHTILAFQRMSFVREDGQEISSALVRYLGGCGIRVYPAEVMAQLGYRPADEDRERACDTSILTNLTVHYRRTNRSLQIVYRDLHDRQIVDWKSPVDQINSYGEIVRSFRSRQEADPFAELAGVYPRQALEEMRALFVGEMVAA